MLFVDGPILGEYFLVGLVCRPGEREHLPVDVDGGEVGYVDVPVNVKSLFNSIRVPFNAIRTFLMDFGQGSANW